MKRRPFHGQPPQKAAVWFNAQIGWIIALSVTAVVLTAARFLVLPTLTNPVEKPVKPELTQENRQRIMLQVQAAMQEFLIQDDWLSDRGDHIEVQIPRKLDFLKLYSVIDDQLSRQKNLTSQYTETGDGNFMLDVHYKDVNACRYYFKRQLPLGYVAIIIDDFGYNYTELSKEFLRLRFPITISIIPGLQSSRTVAREASLLGKEVLVHMPMMPKSAAYDDNGYLLYPGQENSAVRMRLRQAFSKLPNAVGINNHQGSKATSDLQLMRIVMGELKQSNKIFIDSFTTPETVAYKVARQMGVKTTVNKLFIDAEYDEAFMEKQFDRITDMVLSGQHVVAIGHERRKTLSILQKKIPELDEKGVEFVSVSKLVN